MDPLERLRARLAEALRELGVRGSTYECTIAEIYQRLIPYRAVRNDLGFSELPQYEHTLLRLLAGEGECLTVDLPQVQQEFEAELQATNPILGVYRDYAAVGVAIHCGLPQADAANNGAPPPGNVGAAERIAPDESPFGARSAPAAPSAPEKVPDAEAGERAGCPHCGEDLPRGGSARFCPYCGMGIRPIPCAECGEEVEPHWRYCAQCGIPSPFPAR